MMQMLLAEMVKENYSHLVNESARTASFDSAAFRDMMGQVKRCMMTAYSLALAEDPISVPGM